MNIRTLQKSFVSLAFITGLLLVFLMPPIQMPDENSHFKNVYSMSNFDFFPEQKDGVPGKYYPEEILRFVDSNQRFFGNLDEKYSFKEMYYNEALVFNELPLKQQAKVFDTHTALTASPLMYLPQIVGVWVFKLIYANPLFGGINAMKPIHYMYAGRIGNLIAFIIMGYYILKWIPIYKKVVCALMLMPMTISLAASVSYDVMVIGISFLLIAYLMRLIYVEEELNKKHYIILLILSCTLIHLKVVYLSFIGIGILLYKKSKLKKMKFIQRMCILIGIPILLYVVGDFIANINLKGAIDVLGTNTPEQIKFILCNPFQYIKVLINTFIECRGYYLSSFIGTFGSLDTNMPNILIVSYLIYLVVLTLFDSSDEIIISWKQKIVYGGTVVACIILIETALYIGWTSIPHIGGVGYRIVSGVQGRYFIPCSIVGLVVLYNRYFKNKYIRLHSLIEENFINVQKFYCLMTCILVFTRFWE